MFEEQAGAGPEAIEDVWADSDVLFGPGDIGSEPVWDAERFEAECAAHQAWLAARAPDEVAFDEHGLDPVAVPPRVAGNTTEDAAETAQQLLIQADRVQRIADAHRVAALVTAWEESILDLRVRFGSEIGSRQGKGAQAFFTSMGLRLQLPATQVASMVDTALTARKRLPATWAVLLAGDTTWQRVRAAVKGAEGLHAEHWDDFDTIAAHAVVASTRLGDDLHAARERLQGDTAAARARTTYERRALYLDKAADGAASLTPVGPAADAVAADQAITRLAVAAHGVDGDTRTITQLRYDLHRDALMAGLGMIADPDVHVPQHAPVPVQLVLTIPALAWLGHTSEQAILSGYGPIAMQTAKHLAGTATSMLRVLTDPITGVRVAMDRKVYAPPADLRRWVQIRDGRSRFPGGTRPAWLCDVDHARERQHDGQTADRAHGAGTGATRQRRDGRAPGRTWSR